MIGICLILFVNCEVVVYNVSLYIGEAIIRGLVCICCLESDVVDSTFFWFFFSNSRLERERERENVHSQLHH